ncbi:MAG: hypothetical protein FWH04_03265 [Oscillospiraceae bacterium]|nr:hypothetical protein [Oscillospiraceae bacterium]
MSKNELRQYIAMLKEIQELEDERLVWRNKAERWTKALSLTPGQSGFRDSYPFLIDKLQKVDKLLSERLRCLTELRIKVEVMIDSLDSASRRVLRHRYIKGHSWEKIALEMNYSKQRVLQMHSKALNDIAALPE